MPCSPLCQSIYRCVSRADQSRSTLDLITPASSSNLVGLLSLRIPTTTSCQSESRATPILQSRRQIPNRSNLRQHPWDPRRRSPPLATPAPRLRLCILSDPTLSIMPSSGESPSSFSLTNSHRPLPHAHSFCRRLVIIPHPTLADRLINQ